MNTRCPLKRVPSSRLLFFTLQTHHAATQELQRRRTTQLSGSYRQARRRQARLQGSLVRAAQAPVLINLSLLPDRLQMRQCGATSLYDLKVVEPGESMRHSPASRSTNIGHRAQDVANPLVECAATLPDSCQLTLDPNTAHTYLCLSEGNRKVTLRGENQRYPHHPERCDYWEQVLCREGLSGTRCYWEIEWSGGGASIAVTYKGISRKGEDDSRRLGFNDKSWSLSCSDSSYTARHNNNHTAITAPRFPRIGVYLDFNAGTLSFYGVSDTMTLLHRFQTTFTEPLYPGFGLHYYDSPVTICQLN
ncbi:UNVERIFIED_CONTAM: hypothetical protein FKN15_035284 [Acipenser sinensis]